ECRLRGIERRDAVLDRGACDRGDGTLGRRILHVEARAVGSGPPLAPDPQVGGHTREQSLGGVRGRDGLGGGVHADRERRTLSLIRATLGIAMSSSTSEAGSGMCGVVMRTGGASRS